MNTITEVMPTASTESRGNIEAAFRYCLRYRNCGRNDRLGFGLRLAHRQGSGVAAGLVQNPMI
jgi:hypothetical protein